MQDVEAVLALLRQHAVGPADREGMARFGMAMQDRIGVRVPELRRIAKQLGRDHARALALWDTGIPDAQMLAAFTAEPKALTAKQMDAWARSMRSWDVCDQACTNAFARSPLAWSKVDQWAGSSEEFVRRAAFALLAALAVHDKAAADDEFIARLPLIEAASTDERNFVKKAVNWALRQIGKRNRTLHGPALALALRLRDAESRAARWIGSDAARELAAR
jgi:3-methyladenine DNA glycosylase AlkD